MDGHVRSLMVVFSLAVLLTAAYAGGLGNASAVQLDASTLKTQIVGNWERAQDTPSGDVMTITPAPAGYDSGEMPNYLQPEEPQAPLVRKKEVLMGTILNWQMGYPNAESVPNAAQEAKAQVAPATGLLLGGSNILWGAGIAALLIAIVALYWTGRNDQAYSEPVTPIEYPALTSTPRSKIRGHASKKSKVKRKRSG